MSRGDEDDGQQQNLGNEPKDDDFEDADFGMRSGEIHAPTNISFL